MTGSAMATDTSTHSHTPAKIRDDKHHRRPKARRHDSNSNPPRPPTTHAARNPSFKNLGQQSREPTVRESMTPEEFRSWVADMGYPKKKGMTSVDRIPYRSEPICRDLGIQPNRFFAYWRGTEKHKPITINPTLTKLCMCLLARRRAAALMDNLVRQHPECGDMIRQIAASLVLPKVHLGIADLRERAALLHRSAAAVTSEEARRLLRQEADELELRALAMEQKKSVTPSGPAAGSRPAERDGSQNDDENPDSDDIGDWETDD